MSAFVEIPVWAKTLYSALVMGMFALVTFVNFRRRRIFRSGFGKISAKGARTIWTVAAASVLLVGLGQLWGLWR